MDNKELSKSNIRNIETERSCLAGIIKYPETIFQFESVLSDKDFSNKDAGLMYSVLRHLIIDKQVTKIDQAILLSTISNLKCQFSETVNVTQRVAKLIVDSSNIESTNVERFAKDVILYSKRREMWECGTQVQRKMLDGKFESVQQIISVTDEIYFDAIHNFVVEEDMKPMGQGVMERLIQRADNPVEHLGFGSGFKEWDKMIGTFEPDTLTFLAARAKAGKSIFGLNVACHVAKIEKIPVLYLDSELNDEKMGYRLASHLAGVPEWMCKTGKWSRDKDAVFKIENAFKLINNYKEFPLEYISTRGMGIESILSICRRFLFSKVKRNHEGKFNKCLIVYDYIKIDYDNLSGSDWSLNVGKTVVNFKNFLGSTATSALMLGQTNRSGIAKTDPKNNKTYNIDTEESVGLSDEINKTCSSATLLRYKNEQEIIEDGSENGNMLLIPVFSRDGVGGQSFMMSEGIYRKDYINLHRDAEKMTFKEGITKSCIARSKSITKYLNDDKK